MVTLLARSPSISAGGSGSWGTLHQQLSISPATSAGNLHKVLPAPSTALGRRPPVACDAEGGGARWRALYWTLAVAGAQCNGSCRQSNEL